MTPLTNKQQEWYEKPKSCFSYEKKNENKHTNDKSYRKVKDHCHYTGKKYMVLHVAIVF